MIPQSPIILTRCPHLWPLWGTPTPRNSVPRRSLIRKTRLQTISISIEKLILDIIKPLIPKILTFLTQIITNLVTGLTLNWIKQKSNTLIKLIWRHSVQIACITETHLIADDKFKIPSYKVYRMYQINREGGVAIFSMVHKHHTNT